MKVPLLLGNVRINIRVDAFYNMKIIDAHVHLFFDDQFSKDEAKEAGVDFTMEGVLLDYKRHGICKALVIPDEVGKGYMKDNERVKSIVEGNPETFMGSCTLNPLFCKRSEIAKVERDIKSGIFRAIKLFPGYANFYPSDKRCKPIYEMAERNDVPVMFHTGDTDLKAEIKYAHPINVDEVAVCFPNVKFVLCHLGNPWIMDAVEVMSKNSNVHADISGFMMGKVDASTKEYLKGRRDAVMNGLSYNRSIISRLMFGTDYPLTRYDIYIDFIKSLKLTQAEFRKVFFDNAASLYKVTK